jgi:oxygen-dependent protoporphyrinogen oxidase
MVARLGLGEALERSSDATRFRFLLIGGRLRELPLSPPAFVTSGLLPVWAKLRMAAEVLIPARSDLGRAEAEPETDETVYEFGKRRLGREFAELLLDPMVKGIFGGDARRLSLAAAFPRMVELEREYRSLFVAMFKLSRERRRNGRGSVSPGPSGTLHSFARGMAALPLGLAGATSATIHTGRPITRVWRDERGWHLLAGDGAQGPFAAVVDAAPAYAAAAHLEDRELSGLLRDIPYAPMAVIALGFDRRAVTHDLKGFGMLIPSREQRRLLGVLWSSSIFSGRAPEGKVLLTCMAGGPGRGAVLEQDDRALEQMCLEELTPLYGLRGRPERRWVMRHPQAIAQYERGHLARMRRIDRALADRPGLFLTGSSYRGVSVNYCMKAAEATATQVLAYLGGSSASGEA